MAENKERRDIRIDKIIDKNERKDFSRYEKTNSRNPKEIPCSSKFL